VVQPDGWSIGGGSAVYAVLMIPVSLAPWWWGWPGCSMPCWRPRWDWFTWPIPFASADSARTNEDESRKFARDLLKVSVLYLPLLFTR